MTYKFENNKMVGYKIRDTSERENDYWNPYTPNENKDQIKKILFLKGINLAKLNFGEEVEIDEDTYELIKELLRPHFYERVYNLAYNIDQIIMKDIIRSIHE
jgi:hypothetical protein